MLLLEDHLSTLYDLLTEPKVNTGAASQKVQEPEQEPRLTKNKFEMFQTIVSSIHLRHIHIDTTFVWNRKDKYIETKQNLPNL